MIYNSTLENASLGWKKIIYFHWLLLLLVGSVVSIGLLMLYSVANGDPSEWMYPQLQRFGLGMSLMMIIAFAPMSWWRHLAIFGYLACIALLAYTAVAGASGGGAERWIEIGPLRIQPSEFTKLALVLVLASYYSFVDVKHISNPFFIIPPVILTLIPAGLVLIQPDLGTALFVTLVGFAVIFLAGVNIWYFIVGTMGGVGALYAVFTSRGTGWQLLKDYQYDRIDVFLNPELDPSGKGYHSIQSKIALGSGGVDGQGWMQGSQSRLNFLPENHTDFIFTSYAESFGFVGTVALLILFSLISLTLIISSIRNRDRFGALVTGGVAAVFFLFYMVNMAMVMALIPVVGVPLPFVSYGGSAMLMLCMAIGFAQNAHIHRPRDLQ